MNLLTSLDISAGGMTAQRIRMNLISSNLANMYTTRTDAGGPYQRLDPVFTAGASPAEFQNALEAALGNLPQHVHVSQIVEDPRPPRLEYQPNHPDADAEGYVRFPNINVLEEMINMMEASRSYEANVTAISVTKKMVLKALEIGR